MASAVLFVVSMVVYGLYQNTCGNFGVLIVCNGLWQLDYAYVQGMGYFAMVVNWLYARYVLIGLENYVKTRIYESTKSIQEIMDSK